jgi:hypothetical protein
MRVRVAALALAGMLTACAGDGREDSGPVPPACEPPDEPTIFLSRNIQPIFNVSCATSAACHVGALAAADLDLSAGASWDQIVNVRSSEQPRVFRVLPGEPDDSYLVQKIEDAPTIEGQPMPLGCDVGVPQGGAVCLEADDIAAIRMWITECAPDN